MLALWEVSSNISSPPAFTGCSPPSLQSSRHAYLASQPVRRAGSNTEATIDTDRLPLDNHPETDLLLFLPVSAVVVQSSNCTWVSSCTAATSSQHERNPRPINAPAPETQSIDDVSELFLAEFEYPGLGIVVQFQLAQHIHSGQCYPAVQSPAMDSFANAWSWYGEEPTVEFSGLQWYVSCIMNNQQVSIYGV